MQVLPPGSRICLSRVWCLRRSLFGYAACEAYWILPCCYLNLATRYIDSGTLEGTLVQTNKKNCLWLALGKLFGAISTPQLMAASAGPGYTGRTNLCIKAGCYQHWAQGQVSKTQGNPTIFTSPYWLPIRFSHWKSLWMYSTVRCKHHRVGHEEVQRLGLLLSPKLISWCHMERSAPPKKDGVCDEGEWLSTEILAADPSALSPDPQNSDSLYTTLDCSAHPLPEPRVGSCKWNVVHWPFKRVAVSLALSCLLGRQKPHYSS